MANCQSETGNTVLQASREDEADNLSDIRFELECQGADLCSLASLCGVLGDGQPKESGDLGSAFYALGNAAEAIKDKVNGLAARLMDIERVERNSKEVRS